MPGHGRRPGASRHRAQTGFQSEQGLGFRDVGKVLGSANVSRDIPAEYVIGRLIVGTPYVRFQRELQRVAPRHAAQFVALPYPPLVLYGTANEISGSLGLGAFQRADVEAFLAEMFSRGMLDKETAEAPLNVRGDYRLMRVLKAMGNPKANKAKLANRLPSAQAVAERLAVRRALELPEEPGYTTVPVQLGVLHRMRSDEQDRLQGIFGAVHRYMPAELTLGAIGVHQLVEDMEYQRLLQPPPSQKI